MTNKSTLIDNVTNSEPDIVVKTFLKFVLGVNKSTSTMAILGECGQIPFLLQGFLTMLKFWYRIAKLPENMLVNKAFKAQLNESDQSDWLRTIIFLLKYLGMENYPAEYDINKFEIECKKRLTQKFTYEWKSKLKKEDSKLRLYDQ